MAQHPDIVYPFKLSSTQHPDIIYPPSLPIMGGTVTFTGAGSTGIVPDPITETSKFLQDNGSWGAPTDSGLRQSIYLIEMFQAAYSTRFVEYSYTGENLTLIEVWNEPAKLTKLFTRALSYTGDDLTQIVTTDLTSGAVLTKTVSYTGGGDLASYTEVVT